MATADSIRVVETTDIEREIDALDRLTTGQLHDRYAELFGEAPRSRHKRWLVRRVAWRIQANAEGDLSERARRRAEELADDADVRVTSPRTNGTWKRADPPRTAVTRPRRATAVSKPLDPRLPSPGTAITRRYKGRTLEVRVLSDGFEFDGEHYRSLSAVAKAITGSHVNGFRFFGLEAAG